jgi:hypothetical protein
MKGNESGDMKAGRETKGELEVGIKISSADMEYWQSPLERD